MRSIRGPGAVLAVLASLLAGSAPRAVAQILPYKVELTDPVPRPVQIADPAFRLQCQGKTCALTPLKEITPADACRVVRARVGPVAHVARGQSALSKANLETCNAAGAGLVAARLPAVAPKPQAQLPAVTPRPPAALDGGDSIQPKPTEAGPQPEPPTDPSRSGLKDAPAAVPPGAAVPPAAPIPAGAPLPEPGPPPSDAEGFADEMARRRGAQDAAAGVREGLAERARAPEITGFGFSTACLPAAVDTLALRGHRFGPTAGTRRVGIGPPGRRFEVRWVAEVVGWSDREILIRLPSALTAGTWAVAIVDASGNPESGLREFRRCPREFSVSGRIDLGDCAAGGEDFTIWLERDGRAAGFPMRVPVGPDPGDDLAFRWMGDLTPGVFTVLAEMDEGICSGGGWVPEFHRIRISEIDGSPGAPRSDWDFAYRNVPSTVTRIPAVLLVGVLQNLLDGTEIRLNNAGPESPRGSWFKPDDAFIDLSDALGGGRTPLDLPAGRGGAFQYYVNDVNLSSINVRRSGSVVAIVLSFESAGVELKGYCWGTRSMIDLDCPVGPDDSAPDVQIDDLVVRIALPPARFVPDRGPVGISYGAVSVTATANVQARGVCAVVDVCELLTDYKRVILEGIETGLVGVLDQRSLRQTVADGIASAIAASSFGPIGSVSSVAFEGADLVIRHRP